MLFCENCYKIVRDTESQFISIESFVKPNKGKGNRCYYCLHRKAYVSRKLQKQHKSVLDRFVKESLFCVNLEPNIEHELINIRCYCKTRIRNGYFIRHPST